MSDSSRGEAVIRREEERLERDRARARASEENMTNTLASLIRNEGVRKSLAKDAMAATKDSSRRDMIFDKAGAGVYDQDREVITGTEPRPWED